VALDISFLQRKILRLALKPVLKKKPPTLTPKQVPLFRHTQTSLPSERKKQGRERKRKINVATSQTSSRCSQEFLGACRNVIVLIKLLDSTFILTMKAVLTLPVH